jgi:type III secretory pathway component EscT
MALASTSLTRLNGPPMPGVVESLVEIVEKNGLDLGAWGLAWARVIPSITLVPAFGLRAFSTPARIVLGLALAASIAPALRPIASTSSWPVAALAEVARGIPVALTAAVTLWAAGMAGGLVDDLRGAREHAELPNVESGTSPVGALFVMLVSIAFLESGGPARIASALSRPALEVMGPLELAALTLSNGIQLAVAVATPIVVASIVVEVASALVSRAANPAYVQPLLAPLRSLVLLGVLALVLERMVALLAVLAARQPS